MYLRTLGKGWRAVIDTEHLPFCYKPASEWRPYLEDQVPEGALSRSKCKHFKFPEDCELFKEMCNHPSNPFPTRELKIWCNSVSAIPNNDLKSSIRLIGKHIWSFTYVVGPSLDSVRLLYAMLMKMFYLDDLRVIDTQSVGIRNQLNKLNEQGRKLTFPKFKWNMSSNTSPPSEISSLSITGCCDASILDQLLEAYGNSIALKCLEVEGGAIKNSTYFANPKGKPLLPFLKKLQICGGEEVALTSLHNRLWELTHVSFGRRVNGPKSPGMFVSMDRVGQWLSSYRSTLTELHLYLGHIDEPSGQPRRPYNYTLYHVRKLGLPYEYAEWDIFNVNGKCPRVQFLEFHDWAKIAHKQGLRGAPMATAPPISQKERSLMSLAVKKYWDIESLKKVSIFYGKSPDRVVYWDRKRYSSTIVNSRRLNWD